MAVWFKYAVSLLISLFLFWVLLGGFRGGLSGAISTDPIPWPLFILKSRAHEILAQAESLISTGPDALLRVSRGYQDSRALYVFAKLGLAERFLDNTEKTVAKIIQEAELDPIGATKLIERALDLGLLTLVRAPPTRRSQRRRSALDGLEFFRTATTHQEQPPSQHENQASSDDSFAESVCALSSHGSLLTRAHPRSVREAVLFEGEALYERWNGLLERLQPLYYKSKEDLSSSTFRGGIVIPPIHEQHPHHPGQPGMHQNMPFDPLGRAPLMEKEAPVVHQPHVLIFRYAESVVASSVASAVVEDYDFTQARTTVELLGTSLSRHLIHSQPALQRATVILDREVASLMSPGLSSNRFHVNVADAPLHEAGSGSHLRHAYFPANADLYLLVGVVNEWNYFGEDEIVALLQNIHTKMSEDSRLLLVDTFAPSVRASAMTPPRQLLSQKEMNRYIMTQLRNNNLANFQSNDADTPPQPLSAASPFVSSGNPSSSTTPAGGTSALPVVASSLANLKTKSHVLSLVARAGLEVNRSVAVRSGLFSMLVLQRKQTRRIPEPAPVPDPQPPPPEREIVPQPEHQRGGETNVNELVDERTSGIADRPPHEQLETNQPIEQEDNRADNSFELRSEGQHPNNIEHQNQNHHPDDEREPPSHSHHGLTQEDNSAEPQVDPHAENEIQNQREELHSEESHVTEPLGLGHIHDMPESEKDLLNVLGSLGSHQEEEQFQLFEQHVHVPPGERGECLAGDSSCQQQPPEVSNNNEQNNEDNSIHHHAQKRVDPGEREQQEQESVEDTVFEPETVSSHDDHQHSISDVPATPPAEDLSGSQEHEPARQPEPLLQQETAAQKEAPPTGNFFSNFWNPAQPPPPEPQRQPEEPPVTQQEPVQQQDVPPERAQEEQDQHHQQQQHDQSQQHFQHDEQIHHAQHEQPGEDDRYEPPETEPEYPPHEYDMTQPAADSNAHQHGDTLNQEHADNQPFFPASQLHDDLHDVPVEPLN